jgi:hypothetical protein
VFVRIWRAGVLQALATDAVILVGLVLVGVGIWQVSGPGVWIYAGCLCVGVGVLLAVSPAREAPARRERGES